MITYERAEFQANRTILDKFVRCCGLPQRDELQFWDRASLRPKTSRSLRHNVLQYTTVLGQGVATATPCPKTERQGNLTRSTCCDVYTVQAHAARTFTDVICILRSRTSSSRRKVHPQARMSHTYAHLSLIIACIRVPCMSHALSVTAKRTATPQRSGHCRHPSARGPSAAFGSLCL